MIRSLPPCKQCGSNRYIVGEKAELIPGVPAPMGLYTMCVHAGPEEVTCHFLPDDTVELRIRMPGGDMRPVPLHARIAKHSTVMTERA